MNCQNCRTMTEEGCSLCETCEMRFAGTLLRLARDVTPLYDSLDATLHPGGHSPTRIQTATPPTPIRLDVLDLIDMLDATARELWRCLDGIDALDWRKDKRNEDLKATLIACAGHPRLATFADAGFYMHVVDGIARKVDAALDPPGITVKRHTLTVWKSRGKLDVTPQGISYSSVYRLVISGGLDKELTVTA